MGKPQFRFQKFFACDLLTPQGVSGRNFVRGGICTLTQKYNSVSKDVREQIKWLCLFFTKDRDSFEDCLRENDVIPDKNDTDRLKKMSAR